MDNGKRIALGASIAFAVAVVGCVKDDPIVTGNRDAAAAPVVRTAVVPKNEDTEDKDAPDCRTCGQTLETSSSRGTLCRKNKERSSGLLLNELVDCVCLDKCVEQCASYCSGSTREASCLPCIVGPNGCPDIFAECGSDLPGN